MLYIVHCWFFQIPMVNGYVLECIGCIGASCSVPIPVLGPRFPTRCGSLASNSSAALDTFDLNSFSCSSATAPFLRLAYDTEKIRKMIRSPVDPPNGGLSDWTAKKTWLIVIIYHYTLYIIYIIHYIHYYTLYIIHIHLKISAQQIQACQASEPPSRGPWLPPLPQLQRCHPLPRRPAAAAFGGQLLWVSGGPPKQFPGRRSEDLRPPEGLWGWTWWSCRTSNMAHHCQTLGWWNSTGDNRAQLGRDSGKPHHFVLVQSWWGQRWSKIPMKSRAFRHSNSCG